MVIFRGHKLTEEQCDAAKLALTGESLKINAYAGAAKTTTSALIAECKRRRGLQGLYVAFNKEAAESAKHAMTPNVECRTMHSLAYRDIGYQFRHRLKSFFNVYQLMNVPHVIGDTTFFGDSAYTKANFIFQIISRFCYTSDEFIEDHHCPYRDLYKYNFKDGCSASSAKSLTNASMKSLVISAQAVWNEIIKPNSKLQITHDVYLKIWALKKPILRYDFIILDEGQDTNGVFQLVLESTKKYSQVIVVGDTYQQIYKWRGAVDFMENFQTTNETVLSTSFRWGHEIAELSNSIINTYMDRNVDIKGFDSCDTVINQIHDIPDAILCRTNAGLISAITQYIGQCSIKVYGGVNQIITNINGMDKLRRGKQVRGGDIGIFEDWNHLVRFCEEEQSSLTPVYKAYMEHGKDHLIGLFSQCNCQNPDLTISTVHKAKGAEWNKVILWDDFRDTKYDKNLNRKTYSEGETKLLYVAITRAMKQLDITRCSAASNLLTKDEECEIM